MLSMVFLSMILATPFTSSTNPGAKIRISQTGLNYGGNVAVEILSKSIEKLSLPDQSGSARVISGKVQYQVTNMKINSFRQPSTSVTINAGSGLTWSVSNAALSLHGNWHYKYRISIVDIDDSGSFNGEVSDVSVSVSVALGVDASGRPTITSTGCNSQVQNIHVSVQGGADWLYNLFVNDVIQLVRGDLETLICKEARKAIDGDANRELATLPVQVVVERDWLLDYRMVQSPVFSVDYLEAGLKGEFYQKDDRTEAPIEADIIFPNPGITINMVTIWLSDYILNTAGYVLYKRGLVQYTLTASDLPLQDRGYLDTTCGRTTPLCIGGSLEPVRKLFPNASVELDMTVTEAPKAEISSSGISGSFVGMITYNARLADKTLAYLFKTSVKLTVSLVATMDGMTIKGKVTKLKPMIIEVLDTAVGKVSEPALNFLFQTANAFMVRNLNKLGEKGFFIPMIKHVNFTNNNLSFDSHTLCLTTDVQYSMGPPTTIK